MIILSGPDTAVYDRGININVTQTGWGERPDISGIGTVRKNNMAVIAVYIAWKDRIAVQRQRWIAKQMRLRRGGKPRFRVADG